MRAPIKALAGPVTWEAFRIYLVLGGATCICTEPQLFLVRPGPSKSTLRNIYRGREHSSKFMHETNQASALLYKSVRASTPKTCCMACLLRLSIARNYFGAVRQVSDPTLTNYEIVCRGPGFEAMKVREIKNGRLAMVAFLGFTGQYLATSKSPIDNLVDHLKVRGPFSYMRSFVLPRYGPCYPSL